MNIIDAIKSGRRIKEQGGNGDWLYPNEAPGVLIFSRREILVEWEIEEEKLELSASQIISVISKTLFPGLVLSEKSATGAALLKELGFKEDGNGRERETKKD